MSGKLSRTVLRRGKGSNPFSLVDYTSTLYNKRLEELGLLGSHSRKGNCLDNACIESFFSHLKTEMLYINKYTDIDELYQAIGEYIEFYNNERFQKRLNYYSPVEYKVAMAA